MKFKVCATVSKNREFPFRAITMFFFFLVPLQMHSSITTMLIPVQIQIAQQITELKTATSKFICQL